MAVDGGTIAVGEVPPRPEPHDTRFVEQQHAGPGGADGHDGCDRSLAHARQILGAPHTVGEMVEGLEAFHRDRQVPRVDLPLRDVARELDVRLAARWLHGSPWAESSLTGDRYACKSDRGRDRKTFSTPVLRTPSRGRPGSRSRVCGHR